MKRTVLLRGIALALIAMLCIACAAVASAAPAAGVIGENDVIRATAEDVAKVDEENAPRVITMSNGVQIQRTPFSTTNVYGRVVSSWNNVYMNADNRGCLACHTLEAALDSMETFHGAIYMGYDAEFTYATCLGCHGFSSTTEFRDAIHTRHFTSTAFNAMNGTCESCHYIDKEGKYQQWDLVKYDVLRGITDLSADAVEADISWNQTEITSNDQLFYKNPKSEPDEWLFYDEQITEDIYKNWTISVGGDVDNPYEMTIDEMIEKFGTVTQLMKGNCVINGIGDPMVCQVEVTGIPMAKVIEYAAPHADANICYPYGSDGYCYQIYTQEAIDLNGIIVLEINGETLPAGQGYPAAFWAENMAYGNFSKLLNNIKIVSEPEGVSWALYGWVSTDSEGTFYNKPNMGVLSTYNATIFKQGEPIHLEGYADAWDEPITKLEFSFDHGATWIECQTENTVTAQWVYWTMDLNNDFAPGSYLIKMRATSQMADGSERSMFRTADFMFNVQ